MPERQSVTKWSAAGINITVTFLLLSLAKQAKGQCVPPLPPPGTIAMTSPVGGEVIDPGQFVTVSWSATAPPQTPLHYVILYYSYNGGQTWQQGNTIYSPQTSQNFPANFNWCTPGRIRFRVTAYDTCNRLMGTAESGEATSTPTPPPGTITMTSPVGGEVIDPGQFVTVSWSATAPPQTPLHYVILYYSYNGGQTWQQGNTIYSPQTSQNFPANFNWCTPGRIRFRVTAYDTCNRLMGTAESGEATSTPDSTSVMVASPNGGEAFPFGATAPITWSSTGSLGPTVSIQYSLNNGASWTTLVASAPNNGSYTWTIPSMLTNQGLIRIIGSGPCGSISDTSDYWFSIVQNCDDGNPCTADFIDVQSGACAHQDEPCNETTPCDICLLCCEEDCFSQCDLNVDGATNGLDIQLFSLRLSQGVYSQDAIGPFTTLLLP